MVGGRRSQELTEGVRTYYDRQQNDRNLLLSGDSGIVNHHFGLGDFDRTKPVDAMDQDEIAAILNQLEMNQIDALLERLGPIPDGARVLDAGCGRGGSSFVLLGRWHATVDGVTISPYQRRFAQELAARRQLTARARFHLMDYLALDFPTACFDFVFTNESTQYVIDIDDAYREFARVLRARGKYANATWCLNEEYAGKNEFEEPINLHYGTSMNTREEYVQALRHNGFDRIEVDDLTEYAIPYWELRCRWQHRSGVERAFLDGHRSRKILYLLVTAQLE
jgi:geranyl diphosphate 2-C-methyltransferase